MDDQLLALRLKGAQPPVTKGEIVQYDQHVYTVPSSSAPNTRHTIVRTDDSWHCTCLSHAHRHDDCKHILAVKTEFDPPAPTVAPEPVVVRRIPPGTCVKCGSANSKKDGVRRNRLYVNQKYRCLECGFYFSENAGLGRTKLPPRSVPHVMQLASSGMAYRHIMDFLAIDGIVVCAKTVCNTVHRNAERLIEYCDSIRPQVSDVWRTDELYVKVAQATSKMIRKGVYVYAMIDDVTRFMLSSQLAARKGVDDVSATFKKAALLAGKVPRLTISDAAKSIHAAWKECYKPNNPEQKYTAHASAIHMAGNMNNNKMERFNLELSRLMRAAPFVSEKAAAAMAERARLFYNFFHRHSGLGGQTPAEAAGIVVADHNKWVPLLQHAHARKVAG